MSRTIFFYMLRQMLTPAASALVVLAAILWLTQSLQLVDLVLNRGQSLWTLARLTALGLPTLLGAIAPFAFLIGLIFALHRLTVESETVVLFASGLGRTGFAVPVAAASLAAMVVIAILSLYAAPAGSRALKRELRDIRTDLALSLVKPGAFNQPVKGVTVYVRAADAEGRMEEFMLQDRRDPEGVRTYLARRAELRRTPEGPLIVMRDGSIHGAQTDGAVDLLSFEEYAFDAAQLRPEEEARAHEAGQRYVHELLFPDESVYYDRRVWDSLVAAGHARLAGLLHAPAFAALAVAAAAWSAGRRRNAGLSFALALAAGFVVALLAFPLETAAAENPALNAAQYAWPMTVIAFAPFLARLEMRRRAGPVTVPRGAPTARDGA